MSKKELCEIVECPQCEDRDCDLNVCGLCHSISTMLDGVPSGMFTCSGAQINFVRNDYEWFDV